jgi:hypothetical protein
MTYNFVGGYLVATIEGNVTVLEAVDSLRDATQYLALLGFRIFAGTFQLSMLDSFKKGEERSR